MLGATEGAETEGSTWQHLLHQGLIEPPYAARGHATTRPSKIQITSKNSTYHNRMNAALHRARVYCTAWQCGRNIVNHTLHHSTPYHYILYLVYPARHLSFARCTIHIHSYMPSHHLRRLNKPLITSTFGIADSCWGPLRGQNQEVVHDN